MGCRHRGRGVDRRPFAPESVTAGGRLLRRTRFRPVRRPPARGWPWPRILRQHARVPLPNLRPAVRGLSPRAVDEPHRVSTPLELLADLTFVVAIAQLVVALAHGIAEAHALHSLVGYVMVFFAIWWAWVNFTWFASAYDSDDIGYRLLTLVQMAGVLVLAAGVPAAFDGADFTVVTIGYAVMRVALVAQWLRAAAGDPARRPVCLRYAGGIFVVQLGWLARLALPDSLATPTIPLLVLAELTVPYLAERHGGTNWHPHHIAERYGLFTIIVLGESVLAATVAVQSAVRSGSADVELVLTSVTGLALLFALWWLYFLHRAGDGLIAHPERSFGWGYGHYVVFAALAAVGAGLEVAAEALVHEIDATPTAVALATAVPTAVAVAAIWAVHLRLHGDHPLGALAVLLTCAAVLLLGWLGHDAPVPVVLALTTLPVVLLVTVFTWRRSSGDPGPPTRPQLRLGKDNLEE